jgi:hypothetical protein
MGRTGRGELVGTAARKQSIWAWTEGVEGRVEGVERGGDFTPRLDRDGDPGGAGEEGVGARADCEVRRFLYGRRVVVLCDSDVFSSDVFAAILRNMSRPSVG